jgi:hypothetical protein
MPVAVPAAAPAELDDAVERLRLVRGARASGMSWAQIGSRSGMTGKQAKRGAHLLERDTRRAFLLAAQAGAAPFPPKSAPASLAL